MAMKVAAANMKGGVGKTTFTVSLADALSREKKRVLVIDLDGQGHTSRFIARTQERPEFSVAEVMKAKPGDAAEILRKAIRVDTKMPGVHHLPAKITMQSQTFAEQLREAGASPYKILKRRLAVVEDDYDFILLDTPPRTDILTLNALAMADGFVVPVRAGDVLSLDGWQDMEAAIALNVLDDDVNPGLQLFGVVLQEYQAKHSVCKATRDLVVETFQFELFGTVPSNTSVKQASMEGQTILEYDRRCAAANAYVEMAHKILHLAGMEPCAVKRGKKRAPKVIGEGE